jgi:chromate transporter
MQDPVANSSPTPELTRDQGERSAREVFGAFLVLGLTSFGGPTAHLGYFRTEFVARRRWLDERSYADLVALCQFLPGPASSQVGMAIGLSRAGYLGALAAWTAFTLPSAVLLVLFAYGVRTFGDVLGSGWLHGLKVAAVAVVAVALLGMARTLAPDRERATLAIAAAAITLAFPSAWGQVAAIVIGGLVGITLLKGSAPSEHVSLPLSASRFTAVGALLLFFALLVGLPLLSATADSHGIELFNSFYRAGSLVFGGGPVVLPLLQAEVVPPGWISNDAFLAGYGAAQAVPAPSSPLRPISAQQWARSRTDGRAPPCASSPCFFRLSCSCSAPCRSGKRFAERPWCNPP